MNTNMNHIVEIDGSELEGGGQILRVALCMSVLKKIPVIIKNIRAGRSKPGLLEQHLKGVELMRDLSNAATKGVAFQSTNITFHPGVMYGGYFKALVQTAGSITLLLQVALPCCLFAQTETKLELHGGTNTEMAPQVDYTTEVFRPYLEKFGATFDFDLVKRGYFPKGGGKVLIDIRPVGKLNPVILLEQGFVTSIYGWAFVAGSLPMKMADEMSSTAREELKSITENIKIEAYKEDRNIAFDNGAGIILVAETNTGCFLGSSALVNKRERASETAKRATKSLLKSIQEGACADEYCQDQLVILMALANGTSKIRVGEVTLHTKTAIHVIGKFDKTCKFNIISDGLSNIIECQKELS